MWEFATIARKLLASFRRALGPAIRSLVLVLVSFNIAFGFISGVRAEAAGYDPQIFATGLSGLFAAACGALAFLVYVNQQLRRQIRRLENRGSLSAPSPYLPTARLKNCAVDYQRVCAAWPKMAK
jgi:hypothetical protein